MIYRISRGKPHEITRARQDPPHDEAATPDLLLKLDDLPYLTR